MAPSPSQSRVLGSSFPLVTGPQPRCAQQEALFYHSPAARPCPRGSSCSCGGRKASCVVGPICSAAPATLGLSKQGWEVAVGQGETSYPHSQHRVRVNKWVCQPSAPKPGAQGTGPLLGSTLLARLSCTALSLAALCGRRECHGARFCITAGKTRLRAFRPM